VSAGAPDPRPLQPLLQVRRDGASSALDKRIANELRLEMFVNGRRLVAMNCSALGVNELVLGFLWLEQIIDSVDDVDLIKLCLDDRLVEVKLHRDIDFAAYERRRTITSGCGGGVTFADLMEARAIAPLTGGPGVEPRRLFELMAALYQGASWYRASGGLHAGALSDGERLLVEVEDLGRHNCVDKIAGRCLLEKIDPAGRILLSTGRMSSEMVVKAARMGVPMVVSRTSPTDLSVELAAAMGITLVGYVRADRMNVYTHAERLVTAPAPR